ncbi:MAG: 50S ribosomal protein L15 [Patescibacteria group bacterium]|mgnify:CR=1 FL=1
MQLHQLKLNRKRKDSKRIGRGGKRGTYSGKGQKGQKARAGHKIRPAYRDLLQRLPKLRGIKNKPLKSKTVVFNVGDLFKLLGGNLINKKLILEKGLIKNFRVNVKILGEGELKEPVTIEGIAVSKSAREKIEKAGGAVK